MAHKIKDCKEFRYYLATKGVKFELQGTDLIIHGLTDDQLLRYGMEYGVPKELPTIERTMYFKEEGGYYSYKLTEKGEPIQPNKFYEYGTLQELTCTSQRMARLIAKGHNKVAVFG